MTPEQMDELKTLCEKATPGPWGVPSGNVGRVIAWFDQPQPNGSTRTIAVRGIVECTFGFRFGVDEIGYPETEGLFVHAASVIVNIEKEAARTAALLAGTPAPPQTETTNDE